MPQLSTLAFGVKWKRVIGKTKHRNVLDAAVSVH